MPLNPFYFDPYYLLFLGPALLLAVVAQMWVSSAYARASQMGASTSGANVARHLLDNAGLDQVPVEEVPGHLSDHYDPRDDVVRLSSEVFHGRSLAAVGIAAHECGHALQKHLGYVPFTLRSFAVPMASFGSGASSLLLVLGIIFSFQPLLIAGIVLFSGVVIFQLVNLPVEFNASSRAKALLIEQGIVHPQDMGAVNNVLNAAALTYVAATLQAIMQLLYYLSLIMGRGRSRSDE
jgi:Zn-dependent membrane protease YugP